MWEKLTAYEFFLSSKNYEQEFGDLWVLPAQNDFPWILPKH